MLSRVAENLYWMARYVERAENTARLVNVNAFLLLDLPRGIAPGWAPLIAITGSEDIYRRHYDHCDERTVVKFLINDTHNSSAILGSLEAARENCRTVRDIVPGMAWEQLTELLLYARENAQSGIGKRGRHSYLKAIIGGSQRLTGMLDSTMIRDAGYQFMRIGRNLERADMTTRIVDVRTESLLPDDAPDLRPFESIQWVSVLQSLSGYQMYRRAMQMQVKRSEVLRFLLNDTQFPRSVMHCLQAVDESLGALNVDRSSINALRKLTRLLSRAKMDLLKQDELHAFIDNLQLGFSDLHARMSQTYFLPPAAQSQSQSQAQAG